MAHMYSKLILFNAWISGALKRNLGPTQVKEDLSNLGLNEEKAEYFAEQVTVILVDLYVYE